MERWQWFIISNVCAYLMLSGCASDDAYDEIVRGTIAYPFYNKDAPLGRTPPSTSADRFVIRTISGSTEYVVEIPHAGRDYDVEVPIARSSSDSSRKYRIKNAQMTDRELVSSMPKVSQATEQERMLLDKAFGVGEKGGPKQSPSYSLGINKINELYRKGKFEFALIEINNLMTFYPTSVKLYKMKGSVLIKLGNYKLAEKAWTRASDLSPNDPVIKKGIARLKRQIDYGNNTAKKGAL